MSRLSWAGWTGISAIVGIIALVVGLVTLLRQEPSSQPAPAPLSLMPTAVPSPSSAATAVPTTEPPTAGTSQPAVETAAYVDDLAQRCGFAITSGPASINGNAYAHIVQQWAGDTTDAVTLGRKAHRFQATVGVRDDASDRVRAQFELDGDGGRQLFVSKVLGLGETEPVDVSVDGVLRVTLRVKAVSSTFGYAGWGDARVTAPGDLPC